MVKVPTDVENPPFDGNTLIHVGQFINIETSITLGICLNVIVWRHDLVLSLIIWIWFSISWTLLLGEELFAYIFMLLNYYHMGSNSQSIKAVLISNTLLVYTDLTVPMELMISLWILCMMHSMVVNLMLGMMVVKKSTLLANKVPPMMVMFLFALIIYFSTVI